MKVTPNQLHAVRYALGKLICQAFDHNDPDETFRDLLIAADLLKFLQTMTDPKNLAKEKT